ncbi:unnamed protein product [Brassica oleracea]
MAVYRRRRDVTTTVVHSGGVTAVHEPSPLEQKVCDRNVVVSLLPVAFY